MTMIWPDTPTSQTPKSAPRRPGYVGQLLVSADILCFALTQRILGDLPLLQGVEDVKDS